MSNIDHDNNTQQNIVNNFNNFQSQLIKDTGKYPLVAEVYCNSINSLVTGQALAPNAVALNIVDLRGNMRTIYRPSSIIIPTYLFNYFLLCLSTLLGLLHVVWRNTNIHRWRKVLPLSQRFTREF